MKNEPLCPFCREDTIARTCTSRGEWFWKCRNEQCSNGLPDIHGNPATPDLCPNCGKVHCVRFESKKTPGKFFWRCASCIAFYQDNENKPGVPFHDEEKAPCSICGTGKAVRRIDGDR